MRGPWQGALSRERSPIQERDSAATSRMGRYTALGSSGLLTLLQERSLSSSLSSNRTTQRGKPSALLTAAFVYATMTAFAALLSFSCEFPRRENVKAVKGSLQE